jgi:hypothetical protein
MKTIKAFLWMLVFLPAFILSSCDKQPEVKQEGTLELGILLDQVEGQLKSDLADSSENCTICTQYVIISVTDENGELVLDNKRLELYNFGGHWITKEIRLKTGGYKLIKFIVLDRDGNVRFASPLRGSPKAYLVKRPLPLAFEIMKDRVTRVVPEVLRVIDDPPEDFGYVTFSYSVVRILNFFIAVYVDDTAILAPTMWTNAKLTVMADNHWEHSFRLEPRINKISIRDGYRMYMLIVEKEGFNPVKLEISRDELKKTSPDNPLLIGLPVGELHLLVLQPGPERGKDAMISRSMPDDNYGKHPFFEATAISPITSDVQHKITRSLIAWDLNQLPKSATIQRAVLTLYYPYIIALDSLVNKDPLAVNNPSGVDENGIPYVSRYLAVLQSIVSPWEEFEVTWGNQPETTTENQVFIPRKYYIMNDVNCVDCIVPPVKEVVDVTKMLVNTSYARQHGMLMKLVDENYPQVLKFTSSDFESSVYPYKHWPKLEIFYTLP